jgi:hypothetical protein
MLWPMDRRHGAVIGPGGRRRPRRAALLLASLGLAAGGCGGDGGGGEAAPNAGMEAPAPQPPTATRSSVLENPPGWPPVEFEPVELDFGLMAPGETARGTARVHNVGAEPLHIIASWTTCGCTTASGLDGLTIEPGTSVEFSTEMEPKPGLGEKREGVAMRFRGYEPRVEFYIRAEVAFPVRVVPPHITATAELTGQFEVRSQDGRPFSVLRVNDAPPDFVDFDPSTDAPRDRYTIRWDLRALADRGEVPWFWVIETDRAECPVIDIRVRHMSTLPVRPRGRPWVPKAQRVLLGRVAPGEPVEVTAKIEYARGHRPAVDTAAVRSDSTRFRAELVEAVEDGQLVEYRIRVTPAPDASGFLMESIDLNASGFSSPLYLVGRIVASDA